MNKKPLKKIEIFNILKKIKINNHKKEKININKSLNRIISKNIISSINLPPYNNSAVDGYAIRNDDLLENSELNIKHRIVAGDNKNIKLSKGEVARIFTGAKMPINSKTVIMQENIIIKKKGVINIIQKPKKGDNCRLKGEDIKKNQIVLKAGKKINQTNISLISAIGKSKIEVKKKLSIGFFTSGNELKNPTENLKGSEINNSNKYALNSLLDKSYLNKKNLGVLKDSKKIVTKSLINKIKNYSIIITTGGASVGDEDYLVHTIKENGNLFFWKTAIKPGRPLAIGKIKKTLIICLPGNPVSVYLLFGMIIRPFLEFLCGSPMVNPKNYIAKANFSMNKKNHRLEWLRVNINKNKSQGIWVDKFPKQGSGMISSISYSDGIIEIPEHIKKITPGDSFKFYSFNDLFS